MGVGIVIFCVCRNQIFSDIFILNQWWMAQKHNQPANLSPVKISCCNNATTYFPFLKFLTQQDIFIFPILSCEWCQTGGREGQSQWMTLLIPVMTIGVLWGYNMSFKLSNDPGKSQLKAKADKLMNVEQAAIKMLTLNLS